MPHVGMNCLNANFISYATQLPWGRHFLFIQNLICFVTIYTYKLLQAFPPKASVENSSAQWAIFFYSTIYMSKLLKSSVENSSAQWAIFNHYNNGIT